MSSPKPPPRGPWSDLPPEPAPRREPALRWRPAQRPRGSREPFINNWRGVLIIVFLLFVAPFLANWLSHVVMDYMAAR